MSSSLSLSHTILEIWVGDKNLRLLGALMAVDTEQVASHDSRVQPANTFIFPATQLFIWLTFQSL